MEGEWILMVTAKAPSNISVIKYWGKRNEALILAVNESISITLDLNHLCTTTTVAVSPKFKKDRLWLNGKEMSLSSDRYQNCLREIRSRGDDFEDDEKGIKIMKVDWMRLHFHMASHNNFPTGTGLASSAAGFACLVFALAKLMNVKDDMSQLSTIARLGSGSACRGLHGGFVKWVLGTDKKNGKDSFSIQLEDEKHWEDLVVLIAVVSSQQKEISSAEGAPLTVATSPFLHYRAKEVVPKRIVEMERAIRSRDFTTFAKLTCADSNQFHATCLDTSPPLFYMNDTSHRIINCVEKLNRHEEVPQGAYTFDAGCNGFLFARDRKAAALLLRRLLYYFPPNPDTDLSSYILGDKSILKDAGLENIDDVEKLPVPPEIRDKVPAQRFRGNINYFICTRPGPGPVLLSDQGQALLDPVTGFPK
ncbi:hypothetical protein BT93_G2069 [Corymbia citriodora subsp. variegata]|nr:hypothetical protein BT93_G2069 [Corymbia citriodora subsp. variegata]